MWPARVPDAEHPGRVDGERLRPGWVAQPVCAATSVGFGVGAVVLGRSMRGARGVDAVAGRVLVAALAGNGLGSMGFHGPGDRVSKALHDLTLAILAAVSAAGAVRTVVREPASVRSLVPPVGALVIGAGLARLGRTGGPWCRPRSLAQPHAAWHLLAAAAVTVVARRTWGAGGSRRT
jgi:hypothetical protein